MENQEVKKAVIEKLINLILGEIQEPKIVILKSMSHYIMENNIADDKNKADVLAAWLYKTAVERNADKMKFLSCSLVQIETTDPKLITTGNKGTFNGLYCPKTNRIYYTKGLTESTYNAILKDSSKIGEIMGAFIGMTETEKIVHTYEDFKTYRNSVKK